MQVSIVAAVMKYAVLIELLLLLKITYGNDRTWEYGMQKCRDGVHKVLIKFPEPTYKEGETLWTAFYEQTEFLKGLTDSKQEILASNSNSILDALSLLENADRSATKVLRQLRRAYPAKQQCYIDITSGFTKYIGSLNKPIIASINDIAKSTFTVLKQFDRRYIERTNNRCENIDYKALVKSARLNLNIIALIDSIAAAGTYADETYQALGITSLVSCLLLLSVHGTNANIGTVLHEEQCGCDLSPDLRDCFDALDPIVNDTTQLITQSSFADVGQIKQFLNEFAKIIVSYNPSLEEVVGPFGGVGFTANQVRANLRK